jgi:predicted outer membrane repeat protein
VIDMGDTGIGFDDHGDLRYCLTQANTNNEASNEIKFHRGLTGTIVLTQGPLEISKDVTIRGPADGSITISGNHRSGVFDITADPGVQAVTIADLTITGGTGVPFNGHNDGGGLFNDHANVTLSDVVVTGNSVATGGFGGGIYNAAGNMTLNSSTVSANSVGSSGVGGGIYNLTGDMTLNSCTLSGNSVGSNGFAGGVESPDISTLTLNSCTVTGNSVAGGQFGGGGGISGGHVHINSSLIADNHVGANCNGGGVDIGAASTITNSTIEGNTAGALGGGFFVIMALETTDRLVITGSVIRGNQAQSGGGIWNNDGNITIDHTTVSGNSMSGARNGSGLANGFPGQMTITDSIISDNTGGSAIWNSSQMTITGSTISNNSTPFEGGGLRLDYGDANISNCTFSENTAGTSGGGISVSGVSASVTSLELTSVTITANTAATAGGLEAPITDEGYPPLAVLRNTLIAGNSSTGVGPDVTGLVVSLGYNLIGNGDDSRGWSHTDHLGTSANPIDPILGPLHDNGGPTPTQALLFGSPAINGGDPRLFGTVDQRGTVRFHAGQNPPVDVGAFDAGVRHQFQILAPSEVVAGVPFTVTVMAVDANGHTASTFVGAIHFSSSDDAAILPDDYAFAPADAGVATFTITLQTEGSQQLMVNDVALPTIRTSTTLNVDPAAASERALAAFTDRGFADTDPADWWLPEPGRKSARPTA